MDHVFIYSQGWALLIDALMMNKINLEEYKKEMAEFDGIMYKMQND